MVETKCDAEQIERSSGNAEGSPRSSCGSEDIMIRDQLSQTLAHLEPPVSNVNVTKCYGVHIGTEVRTVTQNVVNIKVNKDLPFHRYIWNVAKNTTRAQRLSCGAAMLILITCIVLIIYFTAADKHMEDEKHDQRPPGWYIDRRKWGATEYSHTVRTEDHARLVIIAHTVSPKCTTYGSCTAAVRNIQTNYLNENNYDIPYNFLIGGDGRVYEGRGWNIRGAHTLNYNSCSVGIGFIGDYRTDNVTDLQQERARMLFEEGLKTGKLHLHFHVLGHLDLRPTLSPGEHLYNVIRTWPNYDHENMYASLNCAQIEGL